MWLPLGETTIFYFNYGSYSLNFLTALLPCIVYSLNKIIHLLFIQTRNTSSTLLSGFSPGSEYSMFQSRVQVGQPDWKLRTRFGSALGIKTAETAFLCPRTSAFKTYEDCPKTAMMTYSGSSLAAKLTAHQQNLVWPTLLTLEPASTDTDTPKP